MWVKVVKAKYKCGNDLIPNLIRDKPGSNLWRGLCRAWDNVKENIVWRVGDGRAINCLKDLWIPNIGKLEDFLSREPNLVEASLRVSDISNQEGWVLDKLYTLLPENIV